MKEWCQFQTDVSNWKDAVIPPSESTPRGEFNRSIEEMVELHQAVGDYDGSEQSEAEVAGEATDVIIRMLGLITIVNGNAAELLDNKIKLMQEKYPPQTIYQQVQVEGRPFPHVMREHKTIWERKQRGLGDGK